MAFTRKALAGLGLNEDAIEKVMTLHGTSMSDYIPKTEMQVEINKALEEAKKNAPAPDITKSEEYLKVVGERDMLRELGTETYSPIKRKFRETVYGMIDRSEGAEPVEKQMEKIKADYEEYWETEPQKNTPVFSRKPEKSGQEPTAEDAEVSKALEAWG